VRCSVQSRSAPARDSFTPRSTKEGKKQMPEEYVSEDRPPGRHQKGNHPVGDKRSTCPVCEQPYQGTNECPYCERSSVEIGAAEAVDDIVMRHIRKGDFEEWMAETIGYTAKIEDANKPEVRRAVAEFARRVLAEAGLKL
jgi:hypothetical protein